MDKAYDSVYTALCVRRVRKGALLPGAQGVAMNHHPVWAARAALLISLCLSGCGLFASPAPAPEPAPLSPVQAFIISRTPGTADATGAVDDPDFGGSLRIVLEQEFLSAADATCRRASLLSPQGDTEMVVMCRDSSGNWKMAPRVWGRGLSQVSN